MKKILLFFAAVACSIASWAADEVTATYTSSKLDVALTNETKFVAFQMDIKLGDVTPGTPVLNSDRLTQEGTATIAGVSTDAPFTLAYNVLSDGTLRVIAYNLANREIDLGEGTLFTVSLDGEPTSVEFSNVIFVTKESLAEQIVNATAVKGEDFIPGDVTGDGVINIYDINAVVDFILKNDTSAYNAAAADVTGEGDVNVYDLNAIVELILGK